MATFRICLVFGALAMVLVFLMYCFSFNIISDRSRFVLTSSKIPTRYKTKQKFDKWIVVTSVSYPTEQVKYLSQIPGWRLVVVGDRKTPSNWSLPGCDYLSLDTQMHLGFTLTGHLSFGSYARKNIGYLYAVMQGAKFIYETDDDNSPDDKLEGFVLTPYTNGLMFVGNNIFNPYQHFGQSSLWPRGYPLSRIGSKQNRHYKIGSYWETPTIQQGLVNGDPDVDAIFRLSRKPESNILNVTFDPLAPPVILPEGVFSPFNSQNTLFHHAAFWALFIPTTTTFRVCDIWRGYWAQRLMWEVGGRLAFFPANAFQKRNSHSYLEDAEQEKDIYFKTEKLLQFLRNWLCDERSTFFQCVLKLTSDMAERKFWEPNDSRLVQLWLQDLKSLGYTEPTRVQFSLTLSNFVFHSSPLNRQEQGFYTQHGSENETVLNNVQYSPIEQPQPSLNLEEVDKNRLIFKAEKMLSMCEDFKNISLNEVNSAHMKNSTFYSDILLLITFNHPLYTNVRYLDAIHSLVFKYIVYCGDNQTKFQQETGDLGETLTFIEVNVSKGYYSYLCSIRAMQMGYKVKGFLIAADDVLFKPWALLNSNKSRTGVTFNSQSKFLNISEKSSPWFFWNWKIGRESYLQTIEELKNSDVPSGVTDYIEFQTNTLTHTQNAGYVLYGMSDLYYIPTAIKSSAVWYLSKCYANRLFLEIAVPVVLCGLESREKIYELQGKYIWGRERINAVNYYPKVNLFFHPAKLSEPKVIEVYCKQYFPELLEKLFGFKKM